MATHTCTWVVGDGLAPLRRRHCDSGQTARARAVSERGMGRELIAHSSLLTDSMFPHRLKLPQRALSVRVESHNSPTPALVAPPARGSRRRVSGCVAAPVALSPRSCSPRHALLLPPLYHPPLYPALASTCHHGHPTSPFTMVMCCPSNLVKTNPAKRSL